ncbi:MAG: cupin domain-containing protein [Bacteroidota bacterium]
MAENTESKVEQSVYGQQQILATMVEYQEHSIVSKMLIKKPSGNITLFSFDSGESLSEHTAPFDAMAQVLDGEGKIIIGGKEHSLQAGATIIMPANIPHAVVAEKKFKMLLIMLKS